MISRRVAREHRVIEISQLGSRFAAFGSPALEICAGPPTLLVDPAFLLLHDAGERYWGRRTRNVGLSQHVGMLDVICCQPCLAVTHR